MSTSGPLDDLRKHIAGALADVSEPRASLLAMVRAYPVFASAHPTRWRSIFEHTRTAGSDLPEPTVRKIEALFLQVAESIAAEVLTAELIGRYLDGMVQVAADPVDADDFERPG